MVDNKLPDGSGLDVAERIRSKGSEAPIILISAYDQAAGAPKAEKLRIFDTIQKPFSRETICDAVKKAIGLSPTADQPEFREAGCNKEAFSKSRGNRSNYLSPAARLSRILPAHPRALGEAYRRIGVWACRQAC